MFTQSPSVNKRGKIERYQHARHSSDFLPAGSNYVLHPGPVDHLLVRSTLTDLGLHFRTPFVDAEIVDLRDDHSEVFEWVREPSASVVAAPSIAERFAQLRDTWAEDTQFMSSTSEQFMHFAYQQIIGLGKEGLPFILRDLRDNHEHWFWALAAIAGEDHASGAESFDAARELWLAWGSREGYLS